MEDKQSAEKNTYSEKTVRKGKIFNVKQNKTKNKSKKLSISDKA